MLCTKIQLQSFLGSGEEDFLSVFTINGHGCHLFLNGAELFEQIINTPSIKQTVPCEIW